MSCDSVCRVVDLRVLSTVQSVSGHANRSRRCGCAMAPRGPLIALASEDGAAYVFDIRANGKLLSRIQVAAPGDCVNALDWCAYTGRLVAGADDGNVRAFAP